MSQCVKPFLGLLKFLGFSKPFMGRYTQALLLIFDKKTINSLELENLELLENQSSVIYIEEEYKSDFGIKAAFLEKMISAKANVFTLALQDWKKNDFNFKEFHRRSTNCTFLQFTFGALKSFYNPFFLQCMFLQFIKTEDRQGVVCFSESCMGRF